MSEKKKVSPFVGRPMTTTSARRFVNVQKDRAYLRLWRAAPEAVSYLADIVKGKAEYNEGRFRACVQLLSRAIPVVTAQATAIQSDTTNLSLTAVVGDQKTVTAGVEGDLRTRLERLERHQERMRAVRGEVVDATEAKE